MKATEAIYARRSVRDFTSDVVPESTVRHLIDAAVQAPSAMNSQPWAFVVVQDPEILSTISQRAYDLRRVAEPGANIHHPENDSDHNIFYNATTLVVVCARPEGARPDWDCCLAAENLLLAARDRGVGGCTIGSAWLALSQPDIKELLGIPTEYQPVIPIIIGYPKEFPPAPGRKAPEILSWKVCARV